MNAVIYARYSSHMQNETSIDAQLRECHDYADKNNLVVVGEYCDYAISGKTDARPEFQRMIHDSTKGQFDAVIMYTLDRFSRSRYDSAVYKKRLADNGVTVFYAKQQIPTTPEGIILESILEGYAEYYSENLSRNVKRGLKEVALKGLAVDKRAPLGYVVGDDRKYHVDPLGAKIVNDIFNKYEQGESIASIVAWCNDCGYRTRLGKPFKPNSLHTILSNEKYIGTYRYMDVVIPDCIPPIVKKDLFFRVQELRNAGKTSIRSRRETNVEYLLTGKLFCGNCGSYMIGESGTSKTGKTYHYYTCSHRKRGDCNKKPEKKEWLEKLVIDQTVQHVLTDENIELIADSAIKLWEEEINNNTILLSLNRELHAVNKKLNNLIKSIEDGLYSDTIKIKITELEKRKKELETQIAQEEIKQPNLSREHVIYWLLSFKNRTVNDDNMNRSLIRSLLNSVYVFDQPDGRKKYVLAFNMTHAAPVEITCSDCVQLMGTTSDNPNSLFFFKNVFGIILSF